MVSKDTGVPGARRNEMSCDEILKALLGTLLLGICWVFVGYLLGICWVFIGYAFGVSSGVCSLHKKRRSEDNCGCASTKARFGDSEISYK